MTTNRQWRLERRPDAWPSANDFKLVEAPTPTIGDGELLVRSHFLSVDPYMRGRMRAAKSYAPPVEVGDVIVGGAVGEVLQSRCKGIDVGDFVESGSFGWQDYAALRRSQVRKVDPSGASLSTTLGVLGMPGATAYFGLFDVLRARPGDTLVVSSAAGAVGSVVGQLGKLSGCRVIGTAGTAEKIAWLTEELGFDAGIDYKTQDVGERLKELCPRGINLYFDNVGGSTTDAVMPRLALRGRVAICGQISQYNLSEAEQGPRQLWHLIAKRASIEGFLIFDYQHRLPEAFARLGAWVRSGELKYRETIVDGLDKAPQAFIEMMRGASIGKMLVRVRL